ncbi:hypothetical protein RI367_000931 [Sorochytrium milnesiophthora]
MRFRRLAIGDYSFRGTSHVWYLYERLAGAKELCYYTLGDIHRLLLDRLPDVSSLSSAALTSRDNDNDDDGDFLVFADIEGRVFVSTAALGGIATRWRHEQLEQLCAASVKQILSHQLDDVLQAVGVTARTDMIAEEVELTPSPPAATPSASAGKRKSLPYEQQEQTPSKRIAIESLTSSNSSDTAMLDETASSPRRDHHIPGKSRQPSYSPSMPSAAQGASSQATLPPLRSLVGQLPSSSSSSSSSSHYSTAPTAYTPSSSLPPQMPSHQQQQQVSFASNSSRPRSFSAASQSQAQTQALSSDQEQELLKIRLQQQSIIMERSRSTTLGDGSKPVNSSDPAAVVSPAAALLAPSASRNMRGLTINPVNYGKGAAVVPGDHQAYSAMTPRTGSFSTPAVSYNSPHVPVPPPTTPYPPSSGSSHTRVSTPSRPLFRSSSRRFSQHTADQLQSAPSPSRLSHFSESAAGSSVPRMAPHMLTPGESSSASPERPVMWPSRKVFLSPFEDLYDSMTAVMQQQSQVADTVTLMQRQMATLQQQLDMLLRRAHGTNGAGVADAAHSSSSSNTNASSGDAVSVDYLRKIIGPLQALMQDMDDRLSTVEERAQLPPAQQHHQHSQPQPRGAVPYPNRPSFSAPQQQPLPQPHLQPMYDLPPPPSTISLCSNFLSTARILPVIPERLTNRFKHPSNSCTQGEGDEEPDSYESLVHRSDEDMVVIRAFANEVAWRVQRLHQA